MLLTKRLLHVGQSCLAAADVLASDSLVQRPCPVHRPSDQPEAPLHPSLCRPRPLPCVDHRAIGDSTASSRAGALRDREPYFRAPLTTYPRPHSCTRVRSVQRQHPRRRKLMAARVQLDQIAHRQPNAHHVAFGARIAFRPERESPHCHAHLQPHAPRQARAPPCDALRALRWRWVPVRMREGVKRRDPRRELIEE